MPKRPNETDLEYKRRVIDIKSESFCGAKWYNATIWLGSGQTTSCHHPLPHQIDFPGVLDNPNLFTILHRKKNNVDRCRPGKDQQAVNTVGKLRTWALIRYQTV